MKIKVKVIKDNQTEIIEAPENFSLMEALKFHGTQQYVDGDCGGCCACATCHIHVDDKWLDKIEPADYNSPETDLIEYEKKYDRMKSRLACQITLKKEYDGLTVKIVNE